MRKVMLYTASGEFVVSGWVPAFNVPPDVLVWGDRHFKYDGSDDENVDSYRECIAVALIRVD